MLQLNSSFGGAAHVRTISVWCSAVYRQPADTASVQELLCRAASEVDGSESLAESIVVSRDKVHRPIGECCIQRVGKAVRDAFPSWTTLSTTCWAVGSMSRPCPDYVKHCAAVRTSQTSCHVVHTCPSRSRKSVLSQRGPPRHRMDPVRQCGCGAALILHEHDLHDESFQGEC